MASSKNKPFIFFFLAILAISILMFVKAWHGRRIPRMVVPGNRGIAELFTLDERLVAVFQDGRTCAWDWNKPEIRQVDFSIGSGRVIPLQGTKLAALGRLDDRQLLVIYDLNTAQKTGEMTIGWDDQDIHLRNSHDRSVPVVIRSNPERVGTVEVEISAVNLVFETLRPPVVKTLRVGKQTLRDYAVCDNGIVYAAGNDDDNAWMLAMDLNTGQLLWEQSWPQIDELTTIAIAHNNQSVWAGDSSGRLIAVSAEDGRLISHFSLLKPGETRPATNDFRVLNLVSDSEGKLLACTITPFVYVLEIESELLQLRTGGGHKITSRVTFSPDSQKLATSDLRADGVILFKMLKLMTFKKS